MRFWSAVALAWFLLPCPARACVLCSGNPAQNDTLWQNVARARLVLVGRLANARLTGTDGTGGVTDFLVDSVLRDDQVLGGRKLIELPRYVPADPRDPPRFLLFCDVYRDKEKREQLDPYKGVPIKSDGLVPYVKGLLRLDPRDRAAALLYFFDYLDHADDAISVDAFAEFARANDREIGAVAGRLGAGKLRKWLTDPQTPAERLGLYAFLLGASGAPQDARFLKDLLDHASERTAAAADGILAGYIQLRPREGWDRVTATLGDPARPFPDRFTALRVLRFYRAWKPEETRGEVVRAIAKTLSQGDMADMTVEDLRRWRLWDLTGEVIAQYGKKSHEAPIVRRAIVRYCLTCPRQEAASFVNELRQREPTLVADVAETLRYER